MSNDQYLRGLLDQQELSSLELDALRRLREQIEGQLRVLQGSPRFYYAGSFGKKTMIREQYDLDIVMYWPSDCGYTLEGIYDAVGKVLRNNWKLVNPKTVSWELPFQGGFHIDVVPGRAIEGTYRYANLYRADKRTSMQTSIKIHIDAVRSSGRRDVIRLMKLWRHRKRVPMKKSLALELITIDGCSGVSTSELEKQLSAALRYVRDRVMDVRLVDPANSNNIVSDEWTSADRAAIRAAAEAALKAKYWSEVF